MLTGISIFEGLIVTVFSMIVVFITLIIIATIIKGIKLLSTEKEETKINEEETQTTNKSNIPADYIDEELIAVIAAAISTSMDVSIPNIKIKNIKRLHQKTSLWKEVGKKERLLSMLK